MGVALLIPTFPPHENGHFGPFFTIQSQGIKQTTTLLFILNVLCCKNNLMQKMTSITPPIYKIIHLKIFFKNLASNFDHFQGFRQSYQRPGPFRAILSICFRGPWLGDNPFIMSAHFWTFLTHVIYLKSNILNYLPCLYNL